MSRARGKVKLPPHAGWKGLAFCNKAGDPEVLTCGFDLKHATKDSCAKSLVPTEM